MTEAVATALPVVETVNKPLANDSA
jgi:hypothetical protein